MRNLLILVLIVLSQSSFAADVITKYSDKEVQVDKVVPVTQIISKDKLVMDLQGIDQSIQNLTNQIVNLQAKKVDTQKVFDRAVQLGIKTTAEAAANAKP